MRCEDSRQQLQALIASVRRTTSYLFELERRIDELRFPEDDRLRLATLEAFRASQEMFEVLHELACNGEYSQGQTPREPQEASEDPSMERDGSTI